MNLKNLISSLHDALLDNDIEPDAINPIVMIVLTELWNRSNSDYVMLNDMTDMEYRIVNMWATQNAPIYNGAKMRFIKDMREVFPGLSLNAATHFIRHDFKVAK